MSMFLTPRKKTPLTKEKGCLRPWPARRCAPFPSPRAFQITTADHAPARPEQRLLPNGTAPYGQRGNCHRTERLRRVAAKRRFHRRAIPHPQESTIPASTQLYKTRFWFSPSRRATTRRPPGCPGTRQLAIADRPATQSQISRIYRQLENDGVVEPWLVPAFMCATSRKPRGAQGAAGLRNRLRPNI